MIRGKKDVDWSLQLESVDMQYLRERIDVERWYPMSTFERLGNAILREVANCDLEAVKMWGRFQVDQLRAKSPDLVAMGDPVDTLMRFRVLRSTYFDFEALHIPTLTEEHAVIVVSYQMGRTAEEAASYQTLGFFERLLEVSGAEHVVADFSERSWVGDARTALELSWEHPLPSTARP
jgi:hypothetical protein